MARMKNCEATTKLQPDELAEEVKRMKGIYTNQWFIGSEDAFDTWYDLLKQYSRWQVHQAVTEWFRKGSAEPKPSDIIACVPDGHLDERGRVNEDPLTWPVWLLIDKETATVVKHVFGKTQKDVEGFFKRTIYKDSLDDYILRTCTYDDYYNKRVYHDDQVVPDLIAKRKEENEDDGIQIDFMQDLLQEQRH